jgi:hypothetical protein
MENHLSIEESIRFGWAKTRQHSTIIFQIMMTLFAVEIVRQIVQRVLGSTFEGGAAMALLFVLNTVLGVGFTLITLRIAEGKPVEYRNLIPPMNVWLPYIGATVLAGIVTVLPLVAALVIGLAAFALFPYELAVIVIAVVAAVGSVIAVYFALRYALVRFAILDDHDMVKSLRTSARLTDGRKWWLVGFFIVVCLLNILGAVLLLVGLLVSIPVTMLAFAHVYVKLHTHQA